MYKIEQKGKMVYAAQLTGNLIKDKDIYAAQILNRNKRRLFETLSILITHTEVH